MAWDKPTDEDDMAWDRPVHTDNNIDDDDNGHIDQFTQEQCAKDHGPGKGPGGGRGRWGYEVH